MPKGDRDGEKVEGDEAGAGQDGLTRAPGGWKRTQYSEGRWTKEKRGGATDKSSDEAGESKLKKRSLEGYNAKHPK